jgi:sRNA-binding protein
VGIFTVGFAFGWRITDTFRKRQKLAAQKASKAKAAEEEKKREQVEAEKKKKAAQSQPAPQSTFPKTATIKGQGVRMRASPDVNSEIVGQLDAGQQVTVLDEVAGTDSMTWSRVKAAVKSGGQQKEVEGYVRNDFLEVSQ